FLRTARALIDVHGEEMILRDVNDDIFDPEEDIIENLLNLDKTKDLPPYHDNQSSGNPTPISEPETKSSSSSPTLISLEESELIWEEFEAYLASDSFPPGNSNPSSLLPPFHNSLSGSTTSSSPSLHISETSDYFLEEFADELAHITFPPGNDDLPFDAESDLLELEYLLNHDPIKDMDSILEDSVDENSLDDNLDDTISEEFADELAPSESFPPGNDDMTPEDVIKEVKCLLTQSPLANYSLDNDLINTILEMFTDEHALDYSSPPLWDDYDDNLFDHETVNDDTYDDPFDFKEEKIKDSKILIDELDLPESNNVLPFPECDSVFYEDFSEVDALPSTNNEDKVFNPGILIHENLFEVTNFATPDKNVKKATNASLILEDFNPPLYELSFHKEVHGLGALLSFSPENEEKVNNPGILTSKRVHTSLLPELSHRGTKAFKVTKILESPMKNFPCSYQEDTRVLDVPSLKGYNKGIAESTRCEDQSLLGIWEIYSRDGGIMEAPVLKIECTSTSNLFHRSLQLPDIKVLKRNRQNQLLLNLSQFSEEDRQFTVAGAREHSRSPGSAKDWGYSALTARGFGHYARNGRKPKADLEAHFSYWKIPEVLTCGIKFKLISQLEQVDHNATESVMRNAKKLPDESSRALGEATSSRDSSLIALQTKQTELEKYTALNDLTNHDACVSRYLKDVNARTKKPKKFKSYYKELYENTNQEWKWWIAKRCPTGYTWTQKPLRMKKIWMPKIRKADESTSISPTIDIVSRITNVLKISNSLGSNLSNVPSSANCLLQIKFLGTVRFRNDQFAPILGYGDLIQGNVYDQMGFYYVRRTLHHNLFSVRSICDADLEEYVKDQLCSSCEMSKAKRSSFKSKAVPSSKGRLNLLHMDLCGPMRVASINGKKYILVIVDDYSRYTWTLFLRSKDETPEVLKDFLTMIQRNLQAQVITVRTDRGTEFLNKTLHAYFKEEGIEHQTSTPRTPEQNGVVERRNRTLVEAARTMLSASKLPLSFWAEAVATACYTQNRSIIISTHGKTAYHIINDRKPSIKHLHIFGCICYITRDGENLDKMKEKGDPCVMVGYSTQSKGYRVYNKRTRLIVESIHIKFDEIKEMMSDHNSLVPQGQKASDYDNSDPMPPRQNVVPTVEKTDSSQQGLEFLFSPLLEEYYNPAHGHAEDNNNDQAPNASFQEDEFINPFCTRVQEIGESSSRNIDNTDVHSFQPQSHDYRWTRDHPLEQVRGNPTMPVQTRRQLATDPEMCMFALTVSIVEPKNIKEAMADSAWIEAMQEELHQFDRLKVWELVDKPFGKMIIKLKWLWKNKKDEDQTVIRNKA
ncbi:retrovirus-related pol polyprotein from transposon TNT 1-94, partial [Tanacetum coccineum]